MKDCNQLWAGCDPAHLNASQHITCNNNFVDRANNKAKGGQGYYNIIRSKYGLIENETVKRLRHFSMHYGSQLVVVYNNHIEVDLNFYNGDAGYNLIEGNTIRIPNWHSWSAFQRGVVGEHMPPCPLNTVYNAEDLKKDGKVSASDMRVVLKINENWEGETIQTLSLPIPLSGSFFKHGML